MIRRIQSWSLLSTFLFLSGCAWVPWGGASSVPEGSARHFSSPADAVRDASRLLEARDWRRLSAYYDLEGNGELRAALHDGSFFRQAVSSTSDETLGGHRWRPFHPGSKFSHVNPTKEENVVEVVVEYETEAEGGLKLRGYDSFRMRRSASGWRLLAD